MKHDKQKKKDKVREKREREEQRVNPKREKQSFWFWVGHPHLHENGVNGLTSTFLHVAKMNVVLSKIFLRKKKCLEMF